MQHLGTAYTFADNSATTQLWEDLLKPRLTLTPKERLKETSIHLNAESYNKTSQEIKHGMTKQKSILTKRSAFATMANDLDTLNAAIHNQTVFRKKYYRYRYCTEISTRGNPSHN